MDLRIWVGIDWGSSRHEVCVLREDESRQQRRFDNKGSSIAELVAWLSSMGEPSTIGVALELPHGALIDALLAAGLAVFAINPKQLDRFRDRYTVAAAKDDRRDALTLASSLRTDRPAFRRLRAESPYIVRLREATHMVEDLKRDLRRRTNQLRDLLQRYYVDLLTLVPAADEAWLWDLLALAPNPAKGQRLRASSVQRVLKERRIRRVKVGAVIEALRATPLPASAATVQACQEHVLMILPHLRLLRNQLRTYERFIGEVLDEMEGDEQRVEHRDVRVLRSWPGAGDNVTATVLVERSDALLRRDYHAFRALAGMAPVTQQSGKMRHVAMRRARNQRLQQAVFAWAFSAMGQDPALRAIYDRLRGNGGSRHRALRGVGDRLLRLVVTLLERGEVYNPSRRPAVIKAA